jgi:hypothetical protein
VTCTRKTCTPKLEKNSNPSIACLNMCQFPVWLDLSNPDRQLDARPTTHACSSIYCTRKTQPDQIYNHVDRELAMIRHPWNTDCTSFSRILTKPLQTNRVVISFALIIGVHLHTPKLPANPNRGVIVFQPCAPRAWL